MRTITFALILLQAQLREHRCVGFLVIGHVMIDNVHITQYGFELFVTVDILISQNFKHCVPSGMPYISTA